MFKLFKVANVFGAAFSIFQWLIVLEWLIVQFLLPDFIRHFGMHFCISRCFTSTSWRTPWTTPWRWTSWTTPRWWRWRWTSLSKLSSSKKWRWTQLPQTPRTPLMCKLEQLQLYIPTFLAQCLSAAFLRSICNENWIYYLRGVTKKLWGGDCSEVGDFLDNKGINCKQIKIPCSFSNTVLVNKKFRSVSYCCFEKKRNENYDLFFVTRPSHLSFI